jgi:hypothetical protein
MGVEDFRQQDADRDISAVRNFYAGVLLLAKEALIRAAPNADPEVVIGAKLKPVPDGGGGVAMEQVGHATVDFGQIATRAADFGITLDQKALTALNKIRNDMEHRYTSEPATAVRAAISKAFPVAASLFRHLEEDPLALLGELWTTMLETKELYDQELQAARATMDKVKWHSESITGAFKCDSCDQELIEQLDTDNDQQDLVELRCRTCDAHPDLGDAVEAAVDDRYGVEAYIRAKDTGESGPVYTCPVCDRETLIEDEGKCASCGESISYESECSLCGEGIPLQDYLDGVDGGLCSYHAYQMEKVLRDD